MPSLKDSIPTSPQSLRQGNDRLFRSLENRRFAARNREPIRIALQIAACIWFEVQLYSLNTNYLLGAIKDIGPLGEPEHGLGGQLPPDRPLVP